MVAISRHAETGNFHAATRIAPEVALHYHRTGGQWDGLA